MFFLDDADVVFVGWCASIYTRFQNFCINVDENLQKFGFCCWIEQIKQTFWIWNNESRSYPRFMIGLSWKILLFMKFTQSSMIFWLKFWSFDKHRAFLDVFVDCVVLGWLKPTKLCRMVKIMLQFAIMLFLDNANVIFVGWCGSIYTRFQNFCTSVNEFLQRLDFVSELNRWNKLFGFEITNPVHIHNLWLLWVENFFC